jgi:GNAT superfamily N-acetyltransferase
MRVVVIRTYVQMLSRRDARLDYPEIQGAELRQVETSGVDAYQETFQDIGREVLWVDRWDWQQEDFARQLARNDIRAWMVWKDKTPAGLIEGVLSKDGSIQYTYVGVRPRFQGLGLGKLLLNGVIERSWDMNVAGIWLFTLTSDSEHALKNYLRRGFSVWKRRAAILNIPANLAPQITERMDAARARGAAPGPLRILEAYLRDNPLGAVAMRAVWEVRRLLRSTRHKSEP